MKVRELMSTGVIRIRDDEPVAVAARTLTQYNIGALPVCDAGGRLCGLVTDRDLVTRCMAAGRSPERTPVREVMTRNLHTVGPEESCDGAAALMARRQIRRLPVVQNGRLCGMVALSDLATKKEDAARAGAALQAISSNISAK